jgi:hypothetical protein
MTEIYWITRLDGINTVIDIAVVISVVIAVIFLIGYAVSDWKVTEDKFTKTNLKTFKVFTVIAVLLSLLNVFVPTKKDMFMIYGIGGTIDYIKSNDTAKSMPNKCIEALDKLLDEYIDEDNNNKE